MNPFIQNIDGPVWSYFLWLFAPEIYGMGRQDILPELSPEIPISAIGGTCAVVSIVVHIVGFLLLLSSHEWVRPQKSTVDEEIEKRYPPYV